MDVFTHKINVMKSHSILHLFAALIMVYRRLWTKYQDHAREGSGGFSFHSFAFFFSAKFKLQSDFKLQALTEIEVENRKYFICQLKRFQLLLLQLQPLVKYESDGILSVEW